MRRLACNVFGGITAVVFSRRRFIDLTLLWISLDWHGIPSVLYITSGKLPLSGFQCTLWFICLCVGHLRAVTTSHHHLCSTEVSSASLLSSARSITTSTNIERHSHCPQCQGYPISIIGYEARAWRVDTSGDRDLLWSRAVVHTHLHTCLLYTSPSPRD